MESHRTKVLVEIGLSIALAAVLSLIAVRFPLLVWGGSVSLNMLPLIVIAVRRGLGAGLAAGALYGVVDFMVNPYVVHWIQPLLDYPVAYGLVGLAGLVATPVARSLDRSRTTEFVGWLALGVAMAAAGRFAAHFVAGIVFFGEFAPEGQPVWLYSAIYNSSYIVPSAIAALVAALVIVPVLHRAIPGRGGDAGS